jgi:hypothetical protein
LAGRVGFDCFLLKPSEPEQLKNLLDAYARFALGGAMPDPRRDGTTLDPFSLPFGPDDSPLAV